MKIIFLTEADAVCLQRLRLSELNSTEIRRLNQLPHFCRVFDYTTETQHRFKRRMFTVLNLMPTFC